MLYVHTCFGSVLRSSTISCTYHFGSGLSGSGIAEDYLVHFGRNPLSRADIAVSIFSVPAAMP